MAMVCFSIVISHIRCTSTIRIFTNNFALRASQTIYSGGAITTGIDIAKINREMAHLSYATNREEVRFVIASHYLDLCRMQNRMKVVDSHASAMKPRLWKDIKMN